MEPPAAVPRPKAWPDRITVADYMAFGPRSPWVLELGKIHTHTVSVFSPFIMESRTPEVGLGRLAVCLVSLAGGRHADHTHAAAPHRA